ncbi:hypothetical protein RR48_02638 [Papilio machaon]|uniref:Uncharacterized protein n=1 Tax=Papilio machaon TaxID=76193 RepID=A0A0N1IDN8_PAPMA|nr:hypothetical protein RR48_02638 [Papilio machaon]
MVKSANKTPKICTPELNTINAINSNKRVEGKEVSVVNSAYVNKSHKKSATDELSTRPGPMIHAQNARALSPSSPPPAASEHTATPRLRTRPAMIKKSFADIAREGEWKAAQPSEHWIRVQKNKLKNKFAGNRGKAVNDSESKFKAADIKTPLYIYNVSKDVTSEDILNYIFKKSNVNVTVEAINMKIKKDYNSFKIFVPKHKYSIFMNEDFWPEGIAYRRFVDFRRRSRNDENVLKEMNNGL